MKRTTKYTEYIRSDEWFTMKVDLIQIRGSKCERCQAHRPPNLLQMHHLTYDRLYNEETEDLELLCSQCHRYEHGLIKAPKPKKQKRPKVDKAMKKTIKALEVQLKRKQIPIDVYIREVKALRTKS